MDITDEILTEISYVRTSTYRLRAMKALKGNLKIPSEIAKETGILTNHMSNTLRQLKEHDLAECVNPQSKKGRLYRLTPKGEELMRHIDSIMNR